MSNETTSCNSTDCSGVTIKLPKPSGWRCYLFGGKTGAAVVWYVPEGSLPNRFHRWMSQIFFGCRWEKVK